MSHTYAQNTVHIVFSTKDRQKLLVNDVGPKLHAYIAGICKRHQIFVHAIGGAPEHIHLLIQLPAVVPLAKAVATIKANSSRWAHESGYRLTWQEGYGAFSVSASVIPSVIRYIASQESHHRKMSFEEEFRALLKKHNITFDPRFVLG